MKAFDVIGYVRDGDVFCDNCAADGDPIFADTEEVHACGDCGELFGAVEEASLSPRIDNLQMMEDSLEVPAQDLEQQRRLRR